MSNITDEILNKTDLKIVGEVSPTTMIREGLFNSSYHMFDDGSAEVEVLEFLYSLVRLVKPDKVLETGSYWGFSGAYMALGLRDNQKGHLDTIEFAEPNFLKAKGLWNKLSLDEFITGHFLSSLDFQTGNKYDLVLLDTEPQLRFLELQKFWDNIKPGGIVVIHDLSFDLGIGAPQFWLNKEIIDQKIKDHELNVINFLTPRGLTLLQKFNPAYENFKLFTK